MGEFLEFQEVLQEIRGAMVRKIERINDSASYKHSRRQRMAIISFRLQCRSPREMWKQQIFVISPFNDFVDIPFVGLHISELLSNPERLRFTRYNYVFPKCDVRQ